MSFLSKLFGAKAVTAKEQWVELSLEELPDFLNKEFSSSRKDFEIILQSKLAEVKYLLNSVNSQLKDLNNVKPKEGANDRLLKIFQTSKQQLISRMQSLTQKLSVPNSTDLNVLKNYCEESLYALQKGVFSFSKNIAYTGFLLKEQIKFLGKTIEELNSIFIELNKLFQKYNALLIDFDSEFTELQNMVEEISSSKKSISSLEKQASDTLKAIALTQSELDELRSCEEAKRLYAIEDEIIECNAEIMNLRNNAIALFSKVERPFRKMKNLAEKDPSILTKKQFMMLESYLNDAFLALKTDLRATKLFFLLNKLHQLIDSNAIKFNEKEKEKTLASIKELTSLNFFDEFFWKENDIKRKLNALEAEKAILKVNDKIKSKENAKRLLEAEYAKLKESIKNEKTALKKCEESLFYKKTALQKSISKATNKKVLIKI